MMSLRTVLLSLAVVASLAVGVAVAEKSIVLPESSQPVVDEVNHGKLVESCTTEFPFIKEVPVQHFLLCSENCEKKLYLDKYQDYQQCHSCCGKRYQLSQQVYKQTQCVEKDGKMCNGQGFCSTDTLRCECFPLWGGEDCSVPKRFGYCHAVSEPHWKSFDGLYFNIHKPGEYLQYFDTVGLAREAVTSNIDRYSSVFVNRGVSVRRNGEIVSVTFPTGSVHVNCIDITASIPASGYTTKGGLTIKRTPNAPEVVISSPTGLEVKVHTWAWGQNLWIRIFSTLQGTAAGLCGNFDGQLANDNGWPAHDKDLQPAQLIIESNRITEDESMYNCGKFASANTFEPSAELLDPKNEKLHDLPSARDLFVPVPIDKLFPDLFKLLSPKQTHELEWVFQDCTGPRRSFAVQTCKDKLSAANALTSIVECIEDVCDLGTADLVDSSIEVAAEDMVMNKELTDEYKGMQAKQLQMQTDLGGRAWEH